MNIGAGIGIGCVWLSVAALIVGFNFVSKEQLGPVAVCIIIFFAAVATSDIARYLMGAN